MKRAAALWMLAVFALACGGGDSRFHAHGIVRDVKPELGQVLIEHEDVPGLMQAMTMSFDVPDAELLATLERGQAIAFTIEFDGHSYRVVEARVVGEASGGELPAGFENLAAERDPAPAFELTDQFGNPRSLDSLRGKTLLLDFIFTNCPGPCPILTSRHVTVQRGLPAELRERIWFVSVSLDPVRDTPTAMRRYAEERGADLASWSFLTGPPDEVAAVVLSYGVGSVRTPDGEIEHLVASFVIDAEGRIAERYVGLEHGSDELVRSLVRVASS